MLVARICTIPERLETFRRVSYAIRELQTMTIDRVDVILNGFVALPPDFPSSERIRYRVVPGNGGPAERYRECDGIGAGDVVATLDDDLEYPSDYVERGVSALSQLGGSVTFGGVYWDVAVPPVSLDYHRHRRLVPYPGRLTTAVDVPVLMGGAGFHRGDVFAHLYSCEYEGFATNDDLMASAMLQMLGVKITSVSKGREWIREEPVQDAEHALWRRDRQTRRETFRWLVERRGFVPYRESEVASRGRAARVVIEDGEVPEMERAELSASVSEDETVHIVEVIRGPATGASTREPGRGLEHLVTVPTDDGRLGGLPGIRAWRRRRCDRDARRQVAQYLDWIDAGWPIRSVNGGTDSAQRWIASWLKGAAGGKKAACGIGRS